ncbi:NTP transferase domain-containing protein [Butyrivibrio sp. AE2032]|uniref:NTP transferase domain-containing protein n=1 Tax=Butyrivibrio sp. AE2032 TaxID=1458463 RepID=UPI000B1A75A2|nr:NTP transferase domain-containing protein [Butyrivibrio sp. AE2032]
MSEVTHTVRRAVIMAAGMGNRMHPLTLTTPKPLVKVNGIRMIDSVVNGLKANGINEIYVVVGYLKEQFYDWAKDKDGVTVIENPYFDTCNNISSLYAAREHLEDSIILDGDQIINKTKILDPHFTLSGYNAIWCEGETDEWLMQVEDGIVKSCSRTGGSHGWQLFSVSRWSSEDGRTLKELLELEFEKNQRKDVYWDDIPMFLHPDRFKLGIRIMNSEDIMEIDSLEELQKIDSNYLKINN